MVRPDVAREDRRLLVWITPDIAALPATIATATF
jgi:hypothetical protein